MEEGKREVRKVPVKDKRRHGQDAAKVAQDTPGVKAREDAAQVLLDESSSDEQTPLAPHPTDEQAAEAKPDYLADLQRLQADFDNYRKRMMREQVEIAARAKADFVERLLPVIDNFERAISHGEGGEGVRLVLKELEGVLAAEGIEEIRAEGQAFDPRMHHAVESIEDAQVSEPTVTAVHRRGWRLGERVIRAPMVRVARPVEPAERIDEPADESARTEG